MQLKRREFIPLPDGTATPSRPPASATRPSAAGYPHRRELLQSLLFAVLPNVAGWHQHAAAATLPLERERFVELSEKLCALSIHDRSLANTIQNALTDQYTDDELRRIAALLHSAAPQDVEGLLASSGLHKLAKSIVSVWYSGLLGTGESARVLAYEEALAWRATGYAKAPGTCGEFGDWINQPLGALDRERRP
jgi:hypothetical protein